MNKIRFLTIAVFALILLNVSMLAFFLSRKPTQRGIGPQKIITQRLRFDQTQTADYQKLIEKHRADIRQKETELIEARQAMYNQLLGNDISKNDSLAAHVGQVQTAVEQIHLGHFRDIKNICRADQIADFNALVSDLTKYFSNVMPGKGPR